MGASSGSGERDRGEQEEDGYVGTQSMWHLPAGWRALRQRRRRRRCELAGLRSVQAGLAPAGALVQLMSSVCFCSAHSARSWLDSCSARALQGGGA